MVYRHGYHQPAFLRYVSGMCWGAEEEEARGGGRLTRSNFPGAGVMVAMTSRGGDMASCCLSFLSFFLLQFIDMDG